jgi:hypothetical protein
MRSAATTCPGLARWNCWPDAPDRPTGIAPGIGGYTGARMQSRLPDALIRRVVGILAIAIAPVPLLRAGLNTATRLAPHTAGYRQPRAVSGRCAGTVASRASRNRSVPATDSCRHTARARSYPAAVPTWPASAAATGASWPR